MAARDRLKFRNILGKDNPADLYTKYIDERTKEHHIGNLACKFQGGGAEEAPPLHTLSQSQDEYMCGNNVEECNWIKSILKTIDITRERA